MILIFTHNSQCRLPSFSYHAFSRMLQKSGKKIELMSNPEMFNFVSRAKRGGLTQVASQLVFFHFGTEQNLKSCLSQSFLHTNHHQQINYYES